MRVLTMGAMVASIQAAHAQHTRIPRIGMVYFAVPSDGARVLARELVASKVDIIVTQAVAATIAARQATATTRIVMLHTGNLIEACLIESLRYCRSGADCEARKDVVALRFDESCCHVTFFGYQFGNGVRFLCAAYTQEGRMRYVIGLLRATTRVAVIRIRTLLTASIAIGITAAYATAAADTSNCKMVPIDEWPVRLAHNKLIIDGAVNGQKVGIMLDTGWQRTLVFRTAAARLGLKTSWEGRVRMFDMGGGTDVDSAVVDEFKIGESTRKSWQMYVAGEHDPGDDVSVLLGEDFFRRVDVEFDPAHAAVRLFQSRDCAGAPLAYWATESAASAVDIAPVDNLRPQILLTVRVNGQPVLALLDSGAASSVLDKAVAERLGVTPETPGVVAGGSLTAALGNSPVAYWIGPFQSFVVGSEIIKGVKIPFGDLWAEARQEQRRAFHASRPPPEGQYPAMLLGVDFFVSHRVLIAHSQRKIYFTRAGAPLFQGTAPLPSRYGEGKACDKDADCEGALKCMSDRCARRN